MTCDHKCYICKKEIKEREQYIDVGKDKEGNDLKRHKKCYPGLPKCMKVRKSQTLEKRHHIKESDKIYNRDKAKQNFKKDLNNGQFE